LLEDAGLVRVEKERRERFYALDRQRLRRVVGGWPESFER
jgi:DNA-binding transcriptional ArsR family regulator